MEKSGGRKSRATVPLILQSLRQIQKLSVFSSYKLIDQSQTINKSYQKDNE
jgi:hypothetical protein